MSILCRPGSRLAANLLLPVRCPVGVGKALQQGSYQVAYKDVALADRFKARASLTSAFQCLLKNGWGRKTPTEEEDKKRLKRRQQLLTSSCRALNRCGPSEG